MDLAELGIVYVSEGADAAIAKMEEFRDASVEVIQTDEERVKAAGKVASATEALSAQITRSIISYKGAQSAQYEFAAIAMGANEQILNQIELLKTLEESEAFATSTAKELSQEHRREQGYLQDLAKDIENLNRVRAKEAADAEAAKAKELAARQKYYDDIVAKAKASEQAISDAKHKAILDAQDATARAAAMYIKEENERVKAAEKAAVQVAAANKRAADNAATEAERQAMSEISWAQKSRDEQIRIKAEIQAYKAAGVSDSTISNKFGPAAFTGSIKDAETFADKLEHVRLNTSRVRTEAVVLAHEMVQGRFSRIPATMMVFAEYSDLAAVAMSGFGLAAMGVVAVLVGISVAMVKGILEQRELQNALILTGNFAGTTEGSLSAVAHSATAMGGSIATAKNVILELASSGKFTADQINTVTTAVVAMEHATGGGEDSVKKLVSEFKSLQVEANAHSRYSDEVTKAVLKLDSQYHFLTTSVLAQIRAFEDEGKVKEASALATEEFAKVTEARAHEIVANLGHIEMGWRKIKEVIGEAWSAMKGWGKADTAQDKLLAAAKDLEDQYGDNLYASPMFGGGKSQTEMQAEALKRYNDAWKEYLDVQSKAQEQGKKAATQSEANRALADIEIEGNQMKVEKLNKLNVALEKYHNNLDKLRAQGETPDTLKQLRPEVIAAHEAALAEKFKEKKKPAEHLDVYEKLENDVRKFSQATDDMTESGMRQTAAEKFQSEEMIKLTTALKTHNITLAQYLKLQGSVNAEVERRTLAQNQVEINKAAAAAKEKSNRESEREAEHIKRGNDLLKAAKVAAEDYIETVERLNAAKVKGLGAGSEARSDMAAENTIETRYQKEKDKILREGVAHGKKWEEERLAIAKDSHDKELASYLATRAIMKAAQKDWSVGANEAYHNYLTTINDVAKNTENAFTKAFKGMEDAMVNFVKTGKLDMASLADSIISDFIRIQVQKSIMPGVSGGMNNGAAWLATLFSANGNAFSSSGVQQFADGGTFTNGIYDKPTNFKFANGGGFSLGQMAEAGPEAVMPLIRGTNGKLGVQSSGGGGNSIVVNIIESPGNGGTQNRRSEGGNDVLDVFVDKIKNSIAGDISRGSGSVPSAMASTYGLNRVAGSY